MELVIGEYRITSDPLNYIVEQQRVRGERSKNEGEVYWEPLSYHAKLEHACTWLLRKRISDSDAATLLQVSHEIQKACTAIIRAVEKCEREVRV